MSWFTSIFTPKKELLLGAAKHTLQLRFSATATRRIEKYCPLERDSETSYCGPLEQRTSGATPSTVKRGNETFPATLAAGCGGSGGREAYWNLEAPFT